VLLARLWTLYNEDGYWSTKLVPSFFYIWCKINLPKSLQFKTDCCVYKWSLVINWLILTEIVKLDESHRPALLALVKSFTRIFQIKTADLGNWRYFKNNQLVAITETHCKWMILWKWVP
jgi:hypothetical protein